MTTVAHFINPFLPLTQNWMYNQLRFNRECRTIVLCQTLENTDQFPLKNVFPAFPEKTFFSRLSLTISRLRAQYFSGHYLRVIRRENPEVLHGHFSWESWRNIGIVKKTGLPLVTTFYGLDVNKLSQRRIWKSRYARLFTEGDIFTVEGDHMAEALADIGCPRQKIRVIPLGVDIDKIIRYRVPKTGTTIKIMFVGLQREKKGALYAAATFARSARKNPHCEFHVLGDGPFAAPVKSLLKDEGVLSRSRFYGYVPLETYYGLLGQMDIVIAPSITGRDGDTEGGAPVVVIEAQAAGIPVVGTMHCDIPNIVVDEETGLLCEERDVETLADNLDRLISNKALREKMGKAAHIRASLHFSIQRQVDDLNKLYRSLL
jgi:colanic acid/amylovoran biosynthesis glycosyltransferase